MTIDNPRHFLVLLNYLTTLICFLVLVPVCLAQTSTPTLRPPKAQEALNKGVIAAQEQDYLLAIHYFQDARTIAPDDPLIFMNLGLAESKIPGRELRAIAWFGAYLAANPNASNAAAVKDQIGRLEVTSQGNLSRLIKITQDAARQLSGEDQSKELGTVAGFWSDSGDCDAALKVADLMYQGAGAKSAAQSYSAQCHAQAQDIAPAQKIVDLIQDPAWKVWAQAQISRAQANAGDIAGAQSTWAFALKAADMIQDAGRKGVALNSLVNVQAGSENIAGAQKTADLIQDAAQKRSSLADIGEYQAIFSSTKPTSVLGVSDWLSRLDDDSKSSDCPLNTGPFLDLAHYQQSAPSSDDLKTKVDALGGEVEKFIKAENVIESMLKQQTRKYCGGSDPDLSIGCWTALIQWGKGSNPDLASAFTNRGSAYCEKGQYVQAIADYSEAIRFKPDYARAFNGLCWSRAIRGQIPQALEDCNQSLSLNPYSWHTLGSRGFTYLKMGKYDLAIADYDAALQIATKMASLLYGRGLAKLKKGDTTGADTDIATANKIDAGIAEQFVKWGIPITPAAK